MKALIPILIGLLVVGCGEKEQPNDVKPAPTTNANKGNGTETKPVKELTLREKVVGEYEFKKDGDTGRLVLLENGQADGYSDCDKIDYGKWKIVGKEVHMGDEIAPTVCKIEPNGDLTEFAIIENGRRIEFSRPINYKKIK